MWDHVGRRAPQPHQGEENCDREGRSTARCGRAAEGHGCQGWEERGGPSGQSSPVGGNVTWRFFFFFCSVLYQTEDISAPHTLPVFRDVSSQMNVELCRMPSLHW